MKLAFKALITFTKKEFTDVIRSNKLLVIIILFVVFGIMNPAIAKLTPALIGAMSDSLEGQGFVVDSVEVDALSSWMQFYKNIPMALIAFVLMFAGIMAVEYSRGTLILSVSRGTPKGAILGAKMISLVSIWTVGYWMCYFITYYYNEFYWDNSIAHHLGFAAFLYWLFGMSVILVMILSAVISNSSSETMIITGAYAAIQLVLQMIPDVSDYLPITLTDGYSLNSGLASPEDYTLAVIVTVMVSYASIILAHLAMEKKQL